MARSATVDTIEKFRFGVVWLSPAGTPGALEINGNSVDNTALLQSSELAKAGFHDVQMPKRTTNKIQYREGNDPDIYSVSAGLTTMEDIVLSRGLVSSTTFREIEDWAHLVHASGDTTSTLTYNQSRSKRPTGSNDYRKEVLIFMFNRDGSVARAWKLYNAFPVSYVPGSDLNASEDGEKSLEQLTLAYEDFHQLTVTGGAISDGDTPLAGSAGAAGGGATP